MDQYEELILSIKESGKNFIESFKNSKPIKNNNFNRVILCGMGGSGISADYISKLASDSKFQIVVNKDYHIQHLQENDLVILTSYSGNTEETVSMANQAYNKNCQLILISSGGKFRNLAKEWDVKFIQIKEGLQPRAALPYLLGTLYGLTKELLNLLNIDDEMADRIIKQSQKLNSNNYEEISLSLTNSIPIILTDQAFSNIGLRFRCQLNENSKLLAGSWILPEHNHNGIVSLSGKWKDKQYLVLIYSDTPNNRTMYHFKFYENIIADELFGVVRIVSDCKTNLEIVLDLTWQTDIISVLAAKDQKIDAIEVQKINQLKEYLSSTIS